MFAMMALLTLMETHDHNHNLITHPDYPIPVVDTGHDLIPAFGYDHGEGSLHVHGDMTLSSGTYRYIFIDSGATLTLISPVDVTVNTIFVMPGGRLSGEHLEGRIIFAGPLEPWDKYQFGRGIVALGDVTLRGRLGRITMARLGADTPVDWLTTDLLSVSGSKQYKAQEKRITTTELVRLGEGLKYEHPQSTAGDSPMTANLSRSFQLHGLPNEHAHLMFTGPSRPHIENVECIGMGRPFVGLLDGKKIARYGMHAHHLLAAPLLPSGDRFIFRGNSFRDFGEWAVTVHNSHYGLIADNVVHGNGLTVFSGGNGAGIVFEDLSVGNVCRDNYVAGIAGGGPDVSSGKAEIVAENGAGIWCRLATNHILGNYVGDCEGLWVNGYYFRELGKNIPLYPTAPGQPMSEWQHGPVASAPPASIHGNEISGCETGIWLTWHLGLTNESKYPINEHVGNTIWNCQKSGIEMYHVGGVQLRNTRITANRSVALSQGGAPTRECIGIAQGNHSYQNDRFAIRDSVVEGCNVSWWLPSNLKSTTSGPAIAERCRFSGTDTNLRWGKRLDADVRIIDCTLDQEAKVDVQCQFGKLNMQSFVPQRLLVNRRRVFFRQQAPDYRIPDDFKPNPAYAGKTNAELVAAGLYPISGSVATCATEDARYTGAFVCEEGSP